MWIGILTCSGKLALLTVFAVLSFEVGWTLAVVIITAAL